MKHPFTVDDLKLHRRVSEIDCASSADTAACTVRSIDPDTGSTSTAIWTLSLDGSNTTQLTQGGGDQSPKWSPDGKRLAFLSTRGGGSPQIYLLDLAAGGEARRIGSFSQSVTDLRWFPDGQTLLVAAAVVVDPELRGARTSQPAPIRDVSAPEIAWRLPYKTDGIGYLLQREIHLFAVDIASGDRTQLTDGAFDVLGYDIAGDGRRIVYTRSRDGRFAHRSDLWICEADGTGQRRIVASHATVVQPSWSPDQRGIVFSGSEEEGDAEPKLWCYDVATQAVRRIGSDSLNIADAGSLRWEADDRIVFVRAFRGRHQVVSMALDDTEPTVVVSGDRQFGAFGRSARSLVYTVDHPSLPSEVWTVPRDGGDERQISRFNAWWDDRIAIEATAHAFAVPDGDGSSEMIEGWLIRQAGTTGPTPLLNDVHGGPAAYALLDFETNVYWQVLCSQGWSVLALNAVGSASYGTSFCRRLSGRWGELDMPQHIAAVRRLQEEGIGDDRVAIAGKSYGGFLSAWTIGHDALFRAAVVMAPVGNIETHYGTSDGGYYADPFYVASAPRFDRRMARDLSPLQHIERCTTPTLFLQGKDDERCPKCQSEEMFVSLMRAGDTPTELVLYPNEGHGFLASGTTSTRVDAAGRIVDWLTRYVDADAPALAEPAAVAEETAG